ncbi:MAG: hypothetical protein AAF363_11165 [Bacteroidota bacterium]
MLCISIICDFSIAQEHEEISYSYEETSKKNFRKEKKYDYLDPDLYEQKTLFKIGARGLPILGASTRGNDLSLLVERKIMPSVSIEGGFRGFVTEFNNFLIADAMVQLRYYLNKDKTGSVDNFSGLYTGLRYLRQDLFNNEFARSPNIYELSFGQQQKVGKWGFYDVSALISYSPDQELWQLSVSVLNGLGYGSFEGLDDKYRDKTEQKIYLNKFLWKVSPPRLFLNKRFKFFSFGVDREQSIWKNLSLNVQVFVSHSRNEILSGFPDLITSNLNTYSIGLNGSLRYYYNLKRMEERGSGSKSFHGNYFTFSTGFSYINTTGTEVFNISKLSEIREPDSYFTGWGLQRRIGKRGLFNFEAGLMVFNEFANVLGPVDKSFNIDLAARGSVSLLIGKIK